VLFLLRGRPAFGLDGFQRADGGQQVACLGFVTGSYGDDVPMVDLNWLMVSRSPGLHVELQSQLRSVHGFSFRFRPRHWGLTARGKIGPSRKLLRPCK